MTHPVGLPTFTLPPYGFCGEFLPQVSQLGSLLFTLPLVNIVVHVAVVKAFGKFKGIIVIKDTDPYLATFLFLQLWSSIYRIVQDKDIYNSFSFSWSFRFVL